MLCSQKALELAKDLPFAWMRLALYVLGRVALSRGDYFQARVYLSKTLTKTMLSHMFNVFQAIQALGVLAAAQLQHRRAAVLFGAQEGLAGWTLNMMSPPESSEYEQALAATRASLGEEAFVAAWEEGRSMTDEQVRQFAGELPLENPD